MTRNIIADMEKAGVISAIEVYEPEHTVPVIVTGEDGIDDIYFPYDPGPVDPEALKNSIIMNPKEVSLPGSTLRAFAHNFQQRHSTSTIDTSPLFARGRINVHYCAWPMPTLKQSSGAPFNFRAIQGQMYRWKCPPFDFPYRSESGNITSTTK